MLELKKDMNVFEKIQAFEEQTKLELGEDIILDITLKLGRVSHYIRGNIKSLGIEERLLYDFLLKHKLNHRTVYNWFLLKDAPSDIKKRILDYKNKVRTKNGFSLRKARSMFTDRKRFLMKPQDKIILNEIREYVGSVVR